MQRCVNLFTRLWIQLWGLPQLQQAPLYSLTRISSVSLSLCLYSSLHNGTTELQKYVIRSSLKLTSIRRQCISIYVGFCCMWLLDAKSLAASIPQSHSVGGNICFAICISLQSHYRYCHELWSTERKPFLSIRTGILLAVFQKQRWYCQECKDSATGKWQDTAFT